ncbi:rhamnosidase [Lacrimispora amygdalina]|uniref:alpha-L-rhamnosidase n=1 Tax=Lacrimispora amygdalina TaxID=253257 RepID=A0A3E2NF19_9FIRM|nr:family 78 glycoside hydrolase catalytic domain [Clostridium indicum]RFZ79575.1 rhamnosidase [Clostridium indicum]
MITPALTWYTIDQLKDIEPENPYHKETQPKELRKFGVENLHVLARSTFTVDQTPSEYTLYLSADDYYKLYINGNFITQGPAPAYPEKYYYNKIDITPYLLEGDNVIAVHLYYFGAVNRVFNSADGRFGVAAEIVNEQTLTSTSLAWKHMISNAYSGETVGYTVQYLEDFDSRKWDEEWNQLAFDDSTWEEMSLAQWADYQLIEQPTQTLAIKEQPVELISEISQGHWKVDVGQEVTGSLVLRAKGASGQKIEIRCAEDLDENGDVHYDWPQKIKYQEFWTLADGECRLEAYEYKGFRYAELIVDEGVELLEVKLLLRHYPMDEALCTLTSSVPNLDAVFQLCKNGVRLGTQEGYIDCPTREKGQYLGDSMITSRSQVWLTGKTDMLRKCVDQFAQTRTISEGLMSVSPGSYMQEIADFSLLWSQLLMTDYSFTGDKEFLRTYYPTAKGIVTYFKTFERQDFLLEDVYEKWNLVDWPQEFRDDYDFDLGGADVMNDPVGKGCHNVINALYLGAYKVLNQIETILDLPLTPGWDTLYQSFLKVFYNEQTKLFIDAEGSNHSALHSNMYPLYFDFAPAEAKETMTNLLIERGFNCGVMTTYFIMKDLARAGRKDVVYQLLISEEENSWMNMIKNGATTCSEVWEKTKKWNFSFCHPWASAPISIIIEEIAGITLNPDTSDGFVFQPAVPDEVDIFSLTVPLGEKRIVVYKDEDGKVSIKYETIR